MATKKATKKENTSAKVSTEAAKAENAAVKAAEKVSAEAGNREPTPDELNALIMSTPVEKLNTMPELRVKIEGSVQCFNEAVQTADFNASTKINTVIEEAINKYTSLAREQCFKELKATADPMLEAVKRLTYRAIRVRDTKEGEEKIPVRIVEEIDKPIDLLKLHKAVKDGIGKDSKWNHMIEKFNLLLTAQKAVDLGLDPKAVNDSYAMSDISKQIDMGKTPTSKTNILKTLQSVVTAMIGGEFKATSHDVNFLMSVYSRKNRKALTVTCSNHKALTRLMAEICHRIVENKQYALDYKKAKENA